MEDTNAPISDQPVKPKRKLRWYQYSLRTLFILMFLVACASSWLAVKMQQARRQKEIVDAVYRMGGCVQYDYQWKVYIEFTNPEPPVRPFWLCKILGRDFFCDVKFVDLSSLKDTCLDLDMLNGLKEVKGLDLHNTRISDNELICLGGFRELEYLNVEDTNVTDAGVKDLQKALPNCDIVH